MVLDDGDAVTEEKIISTYIFNNQGKFFSLAKVKGEFRSQLSSVARRRENCGSERRKKYDQNITGEMILRFGGRV